MAMNGDDPTANAEELASSILNRLSSNDLVVSPKRCIFRAPGILRRHNEDAYVPRGFSLGPFHHDNPTLKKTEKIKLRYLEGLISRAMHPRRLLSDMVQAIGEIEKEARACYAEEVDYTAAELVEMLVVDGCFLIEFFRKFLDLSKDEDDPIFSIACIKGLLMDDLILLENQVPWQVLLCLFNMTTDGTSGHLISLVITYLSFTIFEYPINLIEQSLLNQEHKHVVELLRNLLIFPLRLTVSHEWEHFPSAARMEEAGIKFRKRDDTSMLDIQFNDGVLEIPPFAIDEVTERMFRNLISYEQCAPNCRPIVTSYCILLDSLVNETKDLDILFKNEILRSWLNPEDAVHMFNKLYLDTTLNEFCFYSIEEQVNAYCKRRWPKWRAAYVRNYFSTPWAIVSQLLAAFLLILTFLQTFYTIKG